MTAPARVEAIRGSRPRTAAAVAGVMAILVAVFIALLATREPAVDRVADSPLLGQAAPEITGTSLDGERVRLSGLRGRYVVVNFFATWCVPCQREHPELVRFTRTHGYAGDAAVLMVIFDDDPERVREFFAREGGEWPVLDDPRGRIALDYGVFGPPESYLVSPGGVVLSKIYGEVTASGLDQLIAAAEARR